MTTPVVVTVEPASGDAAPVPWISAMVLLPASGGIGGSGATPEPAGLGAPALKSAPLFAVLAWVALRDTEVVLDGAGVGTPPAESLAVVP